jgi:hypothetical protein
MLSSSKYSSLKPGDEYTDIQVLLQ